MDEKGRLAREHSFPATRGAVEKFTAGIPNSQMTIAIEACGIWRGAYNIFRELGYKVKLANQKKVHDIVGSKKMDKEDAKALANLLRTNYLLVFEGRREGGDEPNKKNGEEHEKGNTADDDVGNR
jgi:transposase